jgi:hypothetical protein
MWGFLQQLWQTKVIRPTISKNLWLTGVSLTSSYVLKMQDYRETLLTLQTINNNNRWTLWTKWTTNKLWINRIGNHFLETNNNKIPHRKYWRLLCNKGWLNYPRIAHNLRNWNEKLWLSQIRLTKAIQKLAYKLCTRTKVQQDRSS